MKYSLLGNSKANPQAWFELTELDLFFRREEIHLSPKGILPSFSDSKNHIKCG